MEQLRERFSDDFIRVVKDFCESVTVSVEDFAKALVKIGDVVDAKLGYDLGTSVSHLIDILDKNEKFRKQMQNLISLYGLEGLKIFYTGMFPVNKSGGNVYLLIKEDIPDYISDLITPKPYEGYCDPKHRLPCKPICGYRRLNHWKRTRSNPKLR